MTAPRVACFSEVGDDLGQWRGYGGSMRLCYRFPLRWHLRGVEGPTERALAADALRGRGTPTSCRQGAAYGAAIFPSRVFSADFLTSQDGHENSSMHLRCRWTWSGSQPSAYNYGMPGGLSPNVSCPISGPAIYFRVEKMVGVAGFEPATPTSRTWCATRLRLHRQKPVCTTFQ